MVSDLSIKIKKLTETAQIPTKAHSTDACFDIYCDEPYATFSEMDYSGQIRLVQKNGIKIEPHQAVTLHTGFATEIPEGYFCPVFARSGLGIKQNLRPSNCVGVIDSSYRGEWMVALFNDSNEPKYIQHGDRVAQFAILPVLECSLSEVDELSDTSRGSGGFGSTGK